MPFQWAEPRFTRDQVAQAGRTLLQPHPPVDEMVEAIHVVDNWRSSHQYPLNTVQMTLRRRAVEVDPEAFVWQRIKRLFSVLDKLNRLGRLSLDQLQDLGGCRAVLTDVAHVREVEALYERGRDAGSIVRRTDYILRPRSTGYRGVHLIHRYSASRLPYRGLLVEIQLRSRIQHAWATAVETVDLIRGTRLKAGEGPREWLEFFRLAATAIATLEGTTPVPGTPTDGAAVLTRLRELEAELHATRLLTGYVTGVQHLTQRYPARSSWYLLELNLRRSVLNVRPFAGSTAKEAFDAYSLREQEIRGDEGIHVVLVEAASVDALRRGFPNYFGDTRFFVEVLNGVLNPPR